MPPFHPNATVPVPAPTLPSVTGAGRCADAIARRTSSGVIGRERMALSAPSFVSPTTGLIEPTRSMPGCASSHPTIASAARHTQSVHVSRIGVSSSPSSRTCVTPTSLPNPLPTWIAAGTRSKNRLPACGRMAVTPVRMESPSTTVVWPTRTPATSVIAFNGPGRKTPGATPSARARTRVSCARDGREDASVSPAMSSATARRSRRGMMQTWRTRRPCAPASRARRATGGTASHAEGAKKCNGNRLTRSARGEVRARGEQLWASNCSCRRAAPLHPQPQKEDFGVGIQPASRQDLARSSRRAPRAPRQSVAVAVELRLLRWPFAHPRTRAPALSPGAPCAAPRRRRCRRPSRASRATRR